MTAGRAATRTQRPSAAFWPVIDVRIWVCMVMQVEGSSPAEMERTMLCDVLAAFSGTGSAVSATEQVTGQVSGRTARKDTQFGETAVCAEPV
jgi:hypothetical protein